jgi:xanthine dehydrogenase accessory factor
MTSEETNALHAAEHWLSAGRAVALGTVISTWGSAPRQTGSQIAVRDDGAFVGSVSGGCVEATVIEAAQAAMRNGKVRRLEFGIQDDQAWSVGLACGGRIEIYVEPIITEAACATLRALNAARRQQQPILRAIDLGNGEDHLIDPLQPNSAFALAAKEAIRTDRSQRIEIDGRSWFLCVYNPPVDLVIIGAVHVAQALTKMAALVGHRVRVIDPRAAFTTAERFPGVALTHEYPDEALRRAPLGSRSALVTLSHDPKIDDPALAAALASPAFYVGALGSKKTQAARLERLKARGFSDEKLARIHGPVGLAIGAKSPEEIALSIVAQMTEALRKPA